MSAFKALRARIDAAPKTKRTRQACDWLRLAEAHFGLAEAMVDSGLEDRLTPLKPTYHERLRLGLVVGTFKPPNAAELLADLDCARAGDRAARERVVAYLNLPSVREALDDG